jgi:GAF domain-containing protein
VVHSDPQVAWAREFNRLYPTDPNGPYGVPQVIRSGKPELVPEITDQMLELGARDAEHLRMLRGMGLTSVMIVPLTARGRVLGAISFVSAESGRRYGEPDLAIALDLGRRAGLAVDNARLFKESQEALRLLGLLIEASGRFTGSLDSAAVRAAILDLSHKLIAADAYSIWRLHDDLAEWIMEDSAGLSESPCGGRAGSTRGRTRRCPTARSWPRTRSWNPAGRRTWRKGFNRCLRCRSRRTVWSPARSSSITARGGSTM